jgi:hypothetical protein
MGIFNWFRKENEENVKFVCFVIYSKDLKVADTIEFGNKEYIITKISRLSHMCYGQKKFPLYAIYGIETKKED